MADMTSPAALGIGLASISDREGAVLDTYYPITLPGDSAAVAAAVLAGLCGHTGGSGTREIERAEIAAALEALSRDADENSREVSDVLSTFASREPTPSPLPLKRPVVVTFVDHLDGPPVDAHDVYLRLHLLSRRQLRPHGCNLENAFALLANVVWTDLGPADPRGFEEVRLRLLSEGIPVHVTSVDKFPRMTDYVIPSGVRVADADRVRLGAHLAEGTTVMHEGFVNFNAGTLGKAMIEGRISAGVVVGEDSDLGGSSSVMGTLSGGGTEVVSVGAGCLLGANSGIGISLGDNCVVEAGLYVTAGTRVTLPGGEHVKALRLSGRPDLLFLRNRETGWV